MKKSFTLIELLIVLVIIGIIVALAYPRYEILVVNSQGAEAMSNLRSLADSFWRYYLETGKFPPKNTSPGWWGMPAELDIKVPGDTKYFRYGYDLIWNDNCAMLWASSRKSMITPAALIPIGMITFYTVEFSRYPEMYGVPGERMANNVYRYFFHLVKTPSGVVRKPGWPGGK